MPSSRSGSAAGRPADRDRTFGYQRLEILAAIVNALLLFGVGAFILFEGIRRLAQPPDVASSPMIAVALVGLAGKGVSLWLLRNAQEGSLNARGAFLEVLSDFARSAAVIIAGLVIVVTGFGAADAIASIVIGVLIFPRTWRSSVTPSTSSWRRRQRGSTWLSSARTSSRHPGSPNATTSTCGPSRRE